MSFKRWQAWGIDLSRKPILVFDHPLSKETLSNVLSEPPLEQLWTIPMRPICRYQGEELSASISISPPQEAIESNEVTPQPPFLQTRQTQSPSPHIIGHAFQPFHQLCAFLWRHSRAFTSFSSCGAQNCTHVAQQKNNAVCLLFA